MGADRREDLTTKQRFVIETYRMLETDGLENLKVRDIAHAVGCTPGALYRHFDSLDDLVLLASLKFLDGYVKELIPITKYGKNPIDMLVQSWRCFDFHAFNNPPIYLHLFWGPANLSFQDAMAEYVQLFPPQPGTHDEIDSFYGYYYSAIFESSIRDRDFLWLRRAAGEGLITLDDARQASIVDDCISHAMLMDHISDYRDPGVVEAARAECDAAIERNIMAYVKSPEGIDIR